MRALSGVYGIRSEIVEKISQLIESRDSELDDSEVLAKLELPSDIEETEVSVG